MKFNLIIKEPLNILNDFKYKIYEPDSMIEIFSIIEDTIDQSGKVSFYFECFSLPLNLTLFGDLSVFLEQLSSFYKFAQNEYSEYILDFYEVGTNRKFIFKRIDNEYASIIDFDDHNIHELIQIKLLKKDIIEFINKMEFIINRIAPSINEIDKVREWYSIFII